ncbi:AAA family ATPase, partial [Moorena sp. SIO3H5]|uniref:AAA family ATPase n=1 Tax=Moorena sp. SIO3H5 TaxID=2607834 RepID=UPI0013BE2B43
RQYLNSPIADALKKVIFYDFTPIHLSSNAPSTGGMNRTGEGIVDALADILLSNRKSFDELEERLTKLVPNIKRISLLRGEDRTFSLELVDKYSEHHIPASDISDGTLRILAFLTALYQENTPSIICFEELENGVHPWLLHKMMELLKIVSTEGITGKPVQVLITTHSPVLLNYVEPHQVRAVELDKEGKTQVHKLPTDSVRFQKALSAYDGELGELWFTDVFGGNPV